MSRYRNLHYTQQPQYSFKDDIIHTSNPPYDFYLLKPGAKERVARRTRLGGDGVTSHLVGVFPQWFLPFDISDLPYARDLLSETFFLCPSLWLKYLLITIFISLLPACSLYYSGQIFTIVQAAVDKREVDRSLMVHAFAGAAICNLLHRVNTWFNYQGEIYHKIDKYFAARIIRAKASLDVPTSSDVPTLAKLSNFRDGARSPWILISSLVSFWSISLELASQVWMLLHLLKNQPDSTWLVVGSFANPVIKWFQNNHSVSYACTLQFEGHRRETLSTIVEPRNRNRYRQEIVANDLADYISTSYERATATSQLVPLGAPWDTHTGATLTARVLQILQDAAAEAPRIAFALNALRTPSHIPLSLATLELVQHQVRHFTDLLMSFMRNTGSLRSQIAAIRMLCTVNQLPNLVKDGYKELSCGGKGMSVEFESVAFKYPGQDTLAIENVSFQLPPGALCVIVGANGQGKSSILKLLTRLYDPSHGVIRIQGEPLQNYLLSDLRKSMSVLFQDSQMFPLSMEENIRMGDAATALQDLDSEQEQRIRRAADLGGATEFISKLPRGLNTYFNSETRIAQMVGPDAPGILTAVSNAKADAERNQTTSLSGGQIQRLALARMFMKPPEDVSLLIYDEPSASLDPQAEYDLFERLRALRGTKTMIFSTHRFGYLTKHADVILYMKDSTVVEQGTHAELVAKGGGYASLYRLQASAFAE